MRILTAVVLLSLPLAAQDQKRELEARLLSILEKTVTVLEQDVESATMFVSQAEAEFAAGRKTPLDLFFVRGEVHDARNAVRRAKIELLRMSAKLKGGSPPFEAIGDLLKEMLLSSEERVKLAERAKKITLDLFRAGRAGRGRALDMIASHQLIRRARVEQLKIERALTELALEEFEYGKKQGE